MVRLRIRVLVLHGPIRYFHWDLNAIDPAWMIADPRIKCDEGEQRVRRWVAFEKLVEEKLDLHNWARWGRATGEAGIQTFGFNGRGNATSVGVEMIALSFSGALSSSSNAHQALRNIPGICTLPEVIWRQARWPYDSMAGFSRMKHLMSNRRLENMYVYN